MLSEHFNDVLASKWGMLGVFASEETEGSREARCLTAWCRESCEQIEATRHLRRFENRRMQELERGRPARIGCRPIVVQANAGLGDGGEQTL